MTTSGSEPSDAAGTPALPDRAALRRGRLARLRAEMAACDCAACVLLDPVNIRYATGARNMQVFMLRNPARYLFVPVEGPVILFEFEGCHHLAQGLETIDEVRPAVTVSYVASGPHLPENARRWAAEIAALARRYGGANPRIGIERVSHWAAAALAAHGLEIIDAQAPVERARAVKTPEELACIRASLAVVEAGVAHLHRAVRPGLSENELWSVLHAHVISRDCDYIETRLLSSGSRTNPWFQETGPKIIQGGELVALDTDVVGVHGYYADFSRTFLCGHRRPTAAQRRLYRLAWEQVQHNTDILMPGMSFRDIAEKAWPIPDEFVAHRYFVLAHGVGMTGEYPYILHPQDFDADGYDGTLEPGMTLCVESYIGAEGGREGVKLEDQVLVTETGVERLTSFPYDEDLLGREV
ncbi:MAG: aminopeptidase P family protein [Gammaproteobacteria bacterium]|nr:aminopeptidase P family protein [Gammaproteobacteria bacterium]NIR84521.1 aminopeptidase P family protein [Gammaproteobacteria bacterium]NIR90424.1 aminopeptidase P family protein [Gammaproteobacteria bacterium]NIU05572.1 aminopeptidase P family protein [Gammaproteobacteria bacterium]NIV52711.1 M24 family metallopeptidase [Gammaproteobacteria bacterium]